MSNFFHNPPCTIPAGKALLVPIINAEWSVVEAQGNGGTCIVPAGPTGGYWVMLKPLSAGAHTVHFRGEAVFPELNFTFVTGATYNLTVG